jgi:hypothetical protein
MLNLYKEGRSDLEVMKALGVTRRQWNQYLQRSEAFREMVEWGRELAEAWWEEQSRVNIHNKDFNTNLFKARMAKFYGWADKVEGNNKNVNTDVDIKRLQEELVDKLPDLLKLVPAEKLGALSLPKADTGD